jgi:hypothetical protein
MVGLAASVTGAGVAQPTAEPMSATNETAIKTRNHFCVFTFTSNF